MRKPLLFTSFIALLVYCWLPKVEAVQALPDLTFNIENSNYYGLLFNPKYANLLDATSAFGVDLTFGGREFRLGGTWAKIFQCQHCLKFTGEYLSQQNLFQFLPGSRLLWNEQHAFAMGYSYLILSHLASAINLSAYQARSRDDSSLPPVLNVGPYVDTLYRDVKGADLYGGMLGFEMQPWQYTKSNIDLYYDTLHYRNVRESSVNHQGVGLGITLLQVLHPRILFEINAAHRQIFNQYGAKLNWLIPSPLCTRLELSLTEQYTDGSVVWPKENRIGVMLSYRWNVAEPVSNYLLPYSMQEELVATARKPLVHLPQTFVARDQWIIN